MRLSPILAAALLALAACAPAPPPPTEAPVDRVVGETPEMDALIAKAAHAYNVPVSLVHRVVRRESSYNPRARNGPYYGLMQILPQTARTMGYQGPDSGLYDPGVNLTYGVKYLRGAWLLSHGSESTAVMWYARGYYYEARRRGMLEQVGMK
ncbi:MAG: transglycosylase SLT domain-containing protein [Rhodobacteraceae bacterium]|nr:transglycosylase SLT domain-containing protein [Paracoccaceae bacterium]